jgi:(p)ppGpp synthase/HD superfamily hydrolase
MDRCPPTLLRGFSAQDRARIRDAYAFAHTHLSAAIRRTGESYAVHGCEVAQTLREISDDPALIAAAILHDVLIHPRGRELLRRSALDRPNRSLVERMHALRRLHVDTRATDLDHMIDAFMRDARLLPLRMAHRLNDVRHLDRFSPKLRHVIAHETLHMYAAIAGRLGMMRWRREMEDLCFPVLQPRIAARMRHAFDTHKSLDEACLQHTSAFIVRSLKRRGIASHCEQRIKGMYSTYRKMVLKERTFDELTDRIALRLIVTSIDDCYRALSVVHAHFHPIPGKLKDYIGIPKENGYQSIHTVIYPLAGITEQPIEIQIRTEEMDRACEIGTASHGDYKHQAYRMLATGPSRVELWRNFQHLREGARSSKEFEEALRTYFREDHIVIFDAKDHLYHLHKPATALDFVCLAFDAKCAQLQAVRINGRERPLDTPLQNGDTVEPIFGTKLAVREHWLHLCKHTSSRSLLRGLLAAEEQA